MGVDAQTKTAVSDTVRQIYALRSSAGTAAFGVYGLTMEEEELRHLLAMSGGRMPSCPSSASQGFSSTPLKSGLGKEFPSPTGLEDGVLSDDEDTFSLLSPIYHDSFESDEEELEPIVAELSPRPSNHSEFSISPVRCELPKTHVKQMFSAAVQPPSSPTLGAWEEWLVNKAKEQRLKLEKKSEEEQLRKEKKQEEEREQERKKTVVEEKIQEWLQMKREREKREQLVKQEKEEEETQRWVEKQRDIEQRAQQKYKDWLQRKNQEKIEKEKRNTEEAALKEEQEKERRKVAEAKFKEWLAKANEKSGSGPQSPRCPKSSYDKAYPAPSYYNPIPWKPIHVPPPEISQKKSSSKKPQKQRKKPARF